jgi:hypothetical protein
MANKPKVITDFFKTKPFTIPKNRIPRQDEDDEIIVASSSSSRANTRERTLSPAKRRAPVSPQKEHQNDTSTVKRGRGRPRKDISASPSKLRLETPMLEQETSGNSTPTRRSPRKQMAGMDGLQDAPPDSSGLTSVRSSLKSTPTKSRTVEAVEIPSPAKHSSPWMPAPSQIPAHEPKNTVNTSFSSFSTLTGMSSQSSSRRIVKNGVQAVTNSDSASMSSSSSDDELVDLESFAPRKKRRLTPPVPERDSRLDAPSNAKATRSSTRLSEEHTKKRVKESWRPLSPPPTNKYKHSLLSMVKQSAKEAASEAKIAQAEADMQEAEQLQKRRDNARANAVGTKSMAKEFAQDSEDEERIEMAIERTEVLRGEETFYFFRGEARESMELDLELDTSGLEFLQDDAKRLHACTSGFLATVASQQGLPGQLVSWLHNEIFHEPSDELCESYVGIVDALVKGQHDLPDLAFSLSETHPGQTLRDVEDTDIEGGTSLPPNLKYALMVTAALAPHIAPVTQGCALAELILLNNDEHVRENMDMQIHIERAICSILEPHASDEDLQTVFRETTRQILHASSLSRHILSRAIASLPATILPLHQLRRKLSLHILLDASIDEDIDVTSATTGLRLLQRLKKHASLHISESTDYVTFHSLIDLLDIAIDVGFSDFAFLSQGNQSHHKAALPTKSLFGHTAVSQSPAETAFNAQIDDLISHLRSMGSKIRDAGTSHLKRTEAKSALERLVVRLEAAVRTRPRPRKGVFDRSGNSASAMKGFLKRVESQGEASKSEKTVQAGPGKQHKVTWRDDVVGNGDVGAGADGDADEILKEENEDDYGDDDDSM